VEQLVVLGIIPGTNIQIGFLGWVTLFVIAGAGLYIAHRERSKHTLRLLLIRLSLLRTTRRQRA
jgi:hypothetical protein